MGVLLQAFFKQRPNRAVPAPSDGDPTVPWWWDHVATQANALRLAGFSAVWLPPMLKTSAGAKPAGCGSSRPDRRGTVADFDCRAKSLEGDDREEVAGRVG